jgi:hypothetical protein
MPFYVAHRIGDEFAKVYDKLEDATTHLRVDQLEAAVRALESLRDLKVGDFKVAKKRPVPYEYRSGDLLLVKCLLDWVPGTVMVKREGRPVRFAENRHLGVYLVMKDELAGCADWRTMAAMWLGLAAEAFGKKTGETSFSAPTIDPLTYLMERRGLALHWIEERIRNQVPDYRIIELKN